MVRFLDNLWDRLRTGLQQKVLKQKSNAGTKESVPGATKIQELVKKRRSTEKVKQPVESFFLQTKMFKCSQQKLAMLGDQITRTKLSEAIIQMHLSPKKASKKVLFLLQSARNRIMQTSTYPSEAYYIRQAITGRGTYRKELDFKARGRFGIISHPEAFIKVEIARWNPQAELVRQLRKVISKAKLNVQTENKKCAARVNY